MLFLTDIFIYTQFLKVPFVCSLPSIFFLLTRASQTLVILTLLYNLANLTYMLKLLLLKFYLLKLLVRFMAFCVCFFFCNRKHTFLLLCYFAFITFSEVLKKYLLFRNGFSQALNYLSREYNYLKYTMRI